MTIAPISGFGNTPATLTGTASTSSTGLGGFAAFFAALLGGSESASDVEGAPAGLDGILALLSSSPSGENGDLGAALGALIPPAGEEIAFEPINIPITNFLFQGKPVDADPTKLPNLTPLEQRAERVDALLNSFTEGEAVYEELFVEVRQTVVNLQSTGVNFDSIKGVDGLAKAYEIMGMDPDAALEKATNIVTAIAVMKERFNIEIDGEEKPDLISTIFNMASEESDIFSSEMTFTQINMQMSRSVIAFESSSALSSGDIGMSVLKGDSLQPLVHGEKAIIPENAIATAKASAEKIELRDPSKRSEFVPLTEKDIPLGEKKVLASEIKTLLGEKSVVNNPVVQARTVDLAAQSAVTVNTTEAKVAETATSIFASSAQKMEDDSRHTKRQTNVTNIASDKVIRSAPSADLFTIKPQNLGEKQELVLETPEGEVVQTEELDENFDEVMEVVTRRTSLDARVEGRSQVAMVKQANIASQVDIQMKSLVKQGGGQVNFRLDPPELGELNVRLSISRGTVRGTIIVQSAEVAESLARDLRVLQQSFEEAGLELHKEGIQFKLQEDNSQGAEQQAAGSGGNDTNADEDDDGLIDVDSVDDNANWVKPDSLVDVSI